MRMVMSQYMALMCAVCRENEHGTPDPDAFEAMLVGYVAYKFCPCCKHTVSDFKDRNYRRRVDRWVAKHRKAK